VAEGKLFANDEEEGMGPARLSDQEGRSPDSSEEGDGPRSTASRPVAAS
jgi:hypothetical protein